uniref:C2H2-type domain-containing protein n=1 Tax=Sexangularia sp. CB-2014 TaxID=1486929 RepID=A0A7S1VRT9_9EUKA|mmetsp:Transcript_8876/g.28343  ORF Transcript_8876/g.28343 Transcript_8876/m.28343 type:complete len:188 (+) Transcript_8876:63-626(+)
MLECHYASCDRLFKSQQGLVAHMKWQHEVKNEKLGGDGSDDERCLKRPRPDAPEVRLDADGRRIFVCDVCNPDYHYYNEQSLKRHQMSAVHLSKTVTGAGSAGASTTGSGIGGVSAVPSSPVGATASTVYAPATKERKIRAHECLYPGCEEEFDEAPQLDEHVLLVHASYRPIGRVPHFTLLPQLRT